MASNAAGLFVEEGSILSLGKEIEKMNENVEGLRQETVNRTDEISKVVQEVGSASGQVTSLLLPIIGMIAVIVALQAAMLARRGKTNKSYFLYQ